MSLLYKLYYTNIVFIEKTIDSLIEQQQNTPTPQGIDWGQHKPLVEIFIEEVHIISSF
jgi:hypothetical protein